MAKGGSKLPLGGRVINMAETLVGTVGAPVQVSIKNKLAGSSVQIQRPIQIMAPAARSPVQESPVHSAAPAERSMGAASGEHVVPVTIHGMGTDGNSYSASFDAVFPLPITITKVEVGS